MSNYLSMQPPRERAENLIAFLEQKKFSINKKLSTITKDFEGNNLLEVHVMDGFVNDLRVRFEVNANGTFGAGFCTEKFNQQLKDAKFRTVVHNTVERQSDISVTLNLEKAVLQWLKDHSSQIVESDKVWHRANMLSAGLSNEGAKLETLAQSIIERDRAALIASGEVIVADNQPAAGV